MAEYSTEHHHKHTEKDSHLHHSHHSSHGNHHDNHHGVHHDNHCDQNPDNHHDYRHDLEDHEYYNYGIDYGERARRILEASNHSASAFQPEDHSHRESNTLQPGKDRSQTRRHSMFVDTSNVQLHHGSTPVHNVKQMHLDDIVLAYSKKHPNDRTIGHSDTSHHKHHTDTHNNLRTGLSGDNEQFDHVDHTKRDLRQRNEHAHRSDQNYYRETHQKSSSNHKEDHSYDSCRARLRDLHLSDTSRYQGKQHGDHVGVERRRASDIGARVGPRSPMAIEGHHISMTRANGYRHELSSPELERVKAYRDRESNAKEMERHAMAQVITEACRRRNECEGHGHRRHSGHAVLHSDNMDMPVPGARRHTLASSTGKEIQHRQIHSRKNMENTDATHERLRAHNEHVRHSKYDERHHGSHDDVTSAHTRHHGDFLVAPKITERRHSWTNISYQAH